MRLSSRLSYVSLLLPIACLFGTPNKAIAQLAECSPPRPGEYLLFVVTGTREEQQLLRRSLPQNINLQVCRYLGDTVSRIGGFRRLEDADRWGQFINEIVGLYAAIAQPQASGAGIRITSPPTAPVYQPQVLGAGYAVLVDYLNQPELAAQVKQALGRDVGLASYFSRSYLLAAHTQDEGEANAILRRLSDRGLGAILVDSSRVVLLAPSVNY